MYREERHYLIQVELERLGSVSVAALASRFGISEVTIRKDLRQLAQMGRVQRTHGGAILPNMHARAADWDVRFAEETEEKEAIGRAAAALIRNGDSIILDSGTTTARVAMNLENLEQIDCVTVDPRVASRASLWPNVRVSLSGGYTLGDLPLWGPDCIRNILAHRGADKAFLSAGAVSLETGLSDSHSASHACKRAILEAARETILVAESRKFGTVDGASFARLDEVVCIVTGKGLAGSTVGTLRSRGIEVILA